jgi:hypothetical protein
MIHALSPPRGRTKKIASGGAQIAPQALSHRGIKVAPAGYGFVAGKMHLCRFDFVEKNSIFASRHRRNNFLFTPLAPDIYRK